MGAGQLGDLCASDAEPLCAGCVLAGGFVNAWPGMILQVVLVPLIVMALERARLIPLKEN